MKVTLAADMLKAAAAAGRRPRRNADLAAELLIHDDDLRAQGVAQFLKLMAEAGQGFRRGLPVIAQGDELVHLQQHALMQAVEALRMGRDDGAGPALQVSRQTGDPRFQRDRGGRHAMAAPPVGAPRTFGITRLPPGRRSVIPCGSIGGGHRRLRRYGPGGQKEKAEEKQQSCHQINLKKRGFRRTRNPNPAGRLRPPSDDSGRPGGYTLFMPQSQKEHKPFAEAPRRLLLAWAGVILALIVTLVAAFAINRSEREMTRLLAEKGDSLITAFESILRSGMRDKVGVQLQVLLEEMTRNGDIVFGAIIIPDGTIIAHSDRERIGEILTVAGREADRETLAGLSPGAETRWRLMQIEGHRVFAVWRAFTPGLRALPRGLPMPEIFLGLNPAAFEITRSQNRLYIALLAGACLLVGLCGLVGLNFAQRARISRRRQKLAEDKVRRLEDAMRRQEKLAAMGSLAAGVAHEIRNPLSSIKGYATYFGGLFPEESDEREAAGVMVREVDRLNRVISDLIGLSRPTDVRPAPTDPEYLLQHVARLVRQQAEQRGVVLECRTARRLSQVMADFERLHQALLNLCLNALDAMPDGGRLTLAAAGAGAHVCLIVADTGRGIPPDVLPRIFDPYFTTRGQGTGLGLALAHKIVLAHGGTIAVSSRTADEAAGTGGGTIFRVRLPAAGEGKP